MGYDFECDLFLAELLCERCIHKAECPFAKGEEEEATCQTYQTLEKLGIC